MDVATEYQTLLHRIEQYADPRHQVGMGIAISTQLTVYGVKVPHLRKIAADWRHTYLLGQYKRHIPDLTWEHLDRWRRGVDNWKVGDGLATWVLAVWILAEPETRSEHLWTLIADEDVWSQRLALVATAGLNRIHKDTSFPDLTLQLVERVKMERHPMITKAVSWALRALGEKEPHTVAAYVAENRAVLAGHVVREVENKLQTGLKSGRGKK